MRSFAFAISGLLILGCNASPIDGARLLEDLKYLSSDEMRGRALGSPESKKAREFIVKRFKESGIKPFGESYEVEFAARAKTGTNVVGWMGPSDKPTGKCIVVTAHYDHIGVMSGKVYNGANDNASGTCALFAVAKALGKTKHTIVFVAFDGEESGLLGASAFLKSPPIAKSDIALNINLDMIARDKENELYAVGTYHYPFLKPTLDGVAKRAKVKLLYGYEKPGDKEDWTTMSDQLVFHQAKIPYVFFSTEDFENHHRHTDDYETITKEFYVNSVEAILDTVRSFDKDLDKIGK